MKSTHRVVNDVGYKKLYPMSLREDDTFCHYCGRKPHFNLRLEWDHVPPLDVKIPPEYLDKVHKILIRSCAECNRLASNIPHMDYYERHIWLKSKFLHRYKRLLLNDTEDSESNERKEGYLDSAISNINYRREDILEAIGFGISEIEQIESSVLDLKTKSGKQLRSVCIPSTPCGPNSLIA
jgi:hypothetical protein